MNELVHDFDRVELLGIGGSEETIRLVSDKLFCRLLVEWTRLVMTVENAKDIDAASTILKKYLAPLPPKLGINSIARFGVRTMFVLPYDGNIEELIDYCKSKLYRNLEVFAPFGQIKDVGLIALTISDPRFKTNLTVGPFSREEVRAKISEFKDFQDKFESALMVDVDLYQDSGASYKVGQFIQSALDSARLKVIQFREQLCKE
jgi:hypothetical protein